MSRTRWIACAALAAVLVPASPGCGDDTGGGDDASDDATTDADVAADADVDADADADRAADAPDDAVDPPDEATGPACGDGTCDPGEDPASCPADCTAALPGARFIDDQDFVVPDDAEAGDTVGHAKPYPTVTLLEPAYAVVAGDDAGRFAIDESTGLISVTGAAALEPTTYEVTVEVRARAVDTAVMRIRVIDSTATTFIDPAASATGADGTRAHPRPAWPSRLEAGRVYLQRRGTTWETDGGIEFASGSLLGAWGAGDRPRIRSTGTGHALSGWRRGGVTIRDLELDAPGGTSLVYFNNGGEDPNLVDNCVLHGATWGVRMTGSEPRNAGHRVLYTEIREIGDDGIYVQNGDDLEFGYLHVHRVNTHWSPPSTPQTEASGDGIQLVAVAGFRVHHSKLDRTDSGNKFCLIAAGSQDGWIEHNDFAGPLATPEGGSSLYFGGDSSALTVRFNTFSNGAASGAVLDAVYMHAPGTRFHGNVFRDVPVGIGCRIDAGATPCEVFHNVFFGVPRPVTAGHVVARNNIFQLDGGAPAFDGVAALTQDHNLFSAGAGMPDSLVGDPRFSDPAAGDFRLRVDSPAIDAGVDVGLAEDRSGTPIPQGTAPEIGAYEFVP